MVCLGNICRSPLAQGIMESKLDPDKFYVDSAGTSNYHIGSSPDERSVRIARDNKIDISGQAGRQFQTSDFDKFDHIFVMDESNYDNVIQLARNQSDADKVKLILKTSQHPENSVVPDPYHGDYSSFQRVYNLLDDACNHWANNL